MGVRCAGPRDRGGEDSGHSQAEGITLATTIRADPEACSTLWGLPPCPGHSVLGILVPRLLRPFLEANPPTVSCRLLTLKPKKSDDNITRDRAGSAANYHLTFRLSPAWGDHKKLIHLAQGNFKCSSPPWAARPPKKTACWVSEAGWEGEAG